MDRSRRIDLFSCSTDETVHIGRKIGLLVKKGAIICLFGELGAGKTTLIKGIASSITKVSIEEVCSPTFSYLTIYEGDPPVYHFDLYRLNSAEDFLSLGFDEYLFSNGVCCVEWSERITSILPKEILTVSIHHAASNLRKIDICFS